MEGFMFDDLVAALCVGDDIQTHANNESNISDVLDNYFVPEESYIFKCSDNEKRNFELV